MGVYHQLYHGWTGMGRPCIDSREGMADYGSLHAGVLAACSRLQGLGVRPGEVICIQLSKSRLLLEVILAAMASGCPVLPLNPSYTPREVAYFVRDSGASIAVLEWPEGLPSLPAPRACACACFSLFVLLVLFLFQLRACDGS